MLLARISRRWLNRMAVGTAVVAAVAICIVAFRVAPQFSFFSQARRMNDLVHTLPARRPDGVSEKSWEVAVNWVHTAVNNVCFSATHVPLVEMKRFVNDLESRLSGRVDLDIVNWIWDRLEQTGPHGKQYVANWRQEFLRDLEYQQQKDQPMNSSCH